MDPYYERFICRILREPLTDEDKAKEIVREICNEIEADILEDDDQWVQYFFDNWKWKVLGE